MDNVVDWEGEKVIMSMDIPINYLLKSNAVEEASWKKILAVGIGALQYWKYSDLISRSGLVNNSNAWDALSALGTTAIGVLLFRERMTKKDWLATALIVGGLFLLYQD